MIESKFDPKLIDRFHHNEYKHRQSFLADWKISITFRLLISIIIIIIIIIFVSFEIINCTAKSLRSDPFIALSRIDLHIELGHHHHHHHHHQLHSQQQHRSSRRIQKRFSQEKKTKFDPIEPIENNNQNQSKSIDDRWRDDHNQQNNDTNRKESLVFCLQDDDCPLLHSVCTKNHQCHCIINHRLTENGLRCEEFRCKNSTECKEWDENLICNKNGECICPEQYHFDDLNQCCHLATTTISWFLGIALLLPLVLAILFCLSCIRLALNHSGHLHHHQSIYLNGPRSRHNTLTSQINQSYRVVNHNHHPHHHNPINHTKQIG
ncbi:hypothetical protein SSS_09757 [Sarcoptes scabiei]|uniref:Uncharacterized protein n=1 Tax=Sarcoptes scabiei TaxID=52283 RepID=A0A834RD31_SARSC|nr:hypothetical protein SSS_09757 [Sarcoptes scabiei]